jgi:maltose alpha-D-glucosyltransferase / alpha-amylase
MPIRTATGIGDLPGITAKLDYIHSIGCNAIWLNPIFESPFGDAGYDVADFYRVAASYGTNDDFKNLCAEVHKRGMHVCLDLVAGHSSTANSWFQQSALDGRNRYLNWCIWTRDPLSHRRHQTSRILKRAITARVFQPGRGRRLWYQNAA